VMQSVKIAVRYARYLLANLASLAFALSSN
jgi:hypothetical protein